MFEVPKEYKDVKKDALDFIRAGRDRPFLILRSSPTEPTVSQQASFLNTNGLQDLINKIKLCWASLFTPRAILYNKKMNILNPNIAVIVQQRLNLLKSGSVFSVNPLTNKKNQLLVYVRWGFSEIDAEESDVYIYNTQFKKVESKLVSKQKTLYIFDPQVMKVARRDISDELKGMESLSTKELEILDSAARKINSVFKFPQDIEWGFARGKLYILQSRPITSFIRKPIIAIQDDKEPFLYGIPASPGKFSGKVSLKPQSGSILLSNGLNSNIFQSLFGASALIMETGDLKSLPAVVSRELGIPCIVRVSGATMRLHEGQEISMNAFSGKIYSESQSSHLTHPKVGLPESMFTNQPEIPESDLVPSLESGHPDRPVSVILKKLSDLESTITELVLQETQKRRDYPNEVDEQKSKMISELEWEVRSLREKVEKSLKYD